MRFEFLSELRKLDIHDLLDLHGEERYCKYRAKGHRPDDAYAAALAWQRNAIIQAERRRRHDTGNESPSQRRWQEYDDDLERRLRRRP